MQLYEATNGHIGESYVRCYVWAESEQEARDMIVRSRGTQWLHVRKLFDANDAAFITRATDHGWPDSRD